MALTVACVVAVAVLAWPLKSLVPGVGGDWEWVGTLSYAAEHGLHFGSDLVWTYGPLGFLETPYGAALYYPDTLSLAWLYGGLTELLLAATLFVALRRALPLPLAVLLAAAVLALQSEVGLALGFAWCALLILRTEDRDDRDDHNGRVALPLTLGALTGVVVLGKLNQGLELLVLTAVTLLTMRRRRDALAFAGALLLTAAVGWIATGQRLADVWPYARNGLEPVVGYAAAMGEPEPRHWPLLLALLLAALAVGLGWVVGRRRSQRAGRGLAALCLIFVAFNFKEGFVRQDGLHMIVFFGDLLVVFVLLLAHARRRTLALAAAALATTGVAYGVIMGGHQLAQTLNPYGNAKAFADQVQTLISPARRERLLAASRMQIAAFYRLPPQLVAAVGVRPVMMWPFAYGDLATAYGLHLQPLVALEPYGAYTPRLDRLGAQVLASERAPRRILRTTPRAEPAVDGRELAFEAPLATLQIFCRYRQAAAQDPWQLLARGRDRCGAPRPLATVTARWGYAVNVPLPRGAHALVLVRIDGAGVHGLERVRELALRPHARWISLDGTRHRLVAATASEGLLIAAPRGADYPPPFAMAPDAHTIAVGRDGGRPGGTLRYTFLEVPLAR